MQVGRARPIHGRILRGRARRQSNVTSQGLDWVDVDRLPPISNHEQVRRSVGSLRCFLHRFVPAKVR